MPSLKITVICHFDKSLYKFRFQNFHNIYLLRFLCVDNTIYIRFAALQSPFKLKEDGQGRIYFAQNYRVYAREN